jgi:hypothetical protein
MVRNQFLALGHDAISVDLAPAEDGSQHHIQADLFSVIEQKVFDLGIFFPPCTDLCVSGALHFEKKQASGQQQKSKEFFMRCIGAPIPKISVENPVGVMSTEYREPDQLIHPYQFGHDASKATCLWLKGLRRLLIDPSLYVAPRMVCQECGFTRAPIPGAQMEWFGFERPVPDRIPCQCGGTMLPRWANQTDSGQNRLTPGPKRAMDRSRTYLGIAKAMAVRWG